MQKKIKVLETIRQGKIGGGESHVLTLVSNLDKRRFEPVVLSFTDGPMVEQLTDMGIRVHVIPSSHGFDLTTWTKVRKLIRDEQIDLVHAHGTRALTNVCYACRKENVPLVYTVHGWSFHDSLSAPVYYARMIAEGWLAAKTQKNICVSEANLQFGKEHIAGFEAEVIYNGIDLNRFNPKRALTDIRKEYGIASDQPVIGFIARMTVQKDPVSMVEAFAQVAARHPRAMLLMIGSGELLDEVKSRIKELKLHNRVILDAFRQDVPELLNAIDIFCLPSLWEGMPIGLIEALAMEKAIVASAVDGTRELIRNAFNGLTVNPQEPERLSAAICRLLEDNELRHQLQLNARDSVLTSYNAVVMAEKVERIYHQLVKKVIPQSSLQVN
ncbi:glycosyltransferase family 4 protein [Tellurirhabdus rosea]|uniref:glycosyltransferase family 4 protein n=1 Tax=Tellurirhabdus rosea TaxID=2674997 RepID=UPI002252556B|nr:glycosyltransferase family 4 protein [Tellurirhabdus rosea]